MKTNFGNLFWMCIFVWLKLLIEIHRILVFNFTVDNLLIILQKYFPFYFQSEKIRIFLIIKNQIEDETNLRQVQNILLAL